LRILLFGVAGLLLLAAIGTSSRGATLGLVAVTAYLWWHSPRKGLSLFLISIIVAGVLVYASDLYFERMASISNYEEEGSAQSRILAWKSSTRMAIDNPILGVGAGQFPTQFGTNYRPPDFEGRYMTAHSMYFLILGELGIPGIVTLLVLVIGNLRANGRALVRLKKTPDDEVIGLSRMLLLLNAGMIGFAIAGAFLSVAYYPHIFVVTGLSVAARRIAALQPGGAAVARRPGNAYGGAKKRNNKSAVAKPTQGAVPPVANLPTRGYNRLR
jgi:probable O-glycosylation ligase (exosortase A-associated)